MTKHGDSISENMSLGTAPKSQPHLDFGAKFQLFQPIVSIYGKSGQEMQIDKGLWLSVGGWFATPYAT